jgi:hypothetical protein
MPFKGPQAWAPPQVSSDPTMQQLQALMVGLNLIPTPFSSFEASAYPKVGRALELLRGLSKRLPEETPTAEDISRGFFFGGDETIANNIYGWMSRYRQMLEEEIGLRPGEQATAKELKALPSGIRQVNRGTPEMQAADISPLGVDRRVLNHWLRTVAKLMAKY